MSEKTSCSLADKISKWMEEQVRTAGAKGIVLGISGGLDSSVVAALSKMAMGDNALGLIMPCHSSPEAIEHALIVANSFGLNTETVDLDSAYDELLRVLPTTGAMARANIMPRLRMISLYYIANDRNYLVAGTGNKTEYMVGYFTKWGDGAVDIMPIADLYKRQVRELAKHLGIPNVIIEKPPTADLWPGQTDEGEMGITYDLLDAVLTGLEKDDVSAFDSGVVAKIKVRIAVTEHKRQPSPMFIVDNL